MTYDGENRPLSVTYLGKRTCYVYGVDGKRLKKVEGLPPTQDCTALLANVNATVYFGAVELRNWKVAGQEQVLAYPHPAIKFLNGATPAAATYLHRDGLSSVRAITSAAGAKIEAALYKPFGEQSEWVLPGNAAPETKGWIGERYDADAGLQYLNARYHDPDLSLFLQPDWFEVTKDGVGTNRFSYSFNDPVNGFDPNGNETCNADGNGCRPDENDPPPCEDSGNCDHSGDWIPTAFDTAVDFVPIIGDAKGIYEAEGVLDTLGAIASAAIGPFGDAIKVARKFDKAAKAASDAQTIDASKIGKGAYDVSNDGKVVPKPYGKKGSPSTKQK